MFFSYQKPLPQTYMKEKVISTDIGTTQYGLSHSESPLQAQSHTPN